jgi:hypothetical protein
MRAALLLVAFLACGDAYLSDPIEAGLRPHHATGASVEDPLLFRHQFQGCSFFPIESWCGPILTAAYNL